MTQHTYALEGLEVSLQGLIIHLYSLITPKAQDVLISYIICTRTYDRRYL